VLNPWYDEMAWTGRTMVQVRCRDPNLLDRYLARLECYYKIMRRNDMAIRFFLISQLSISFHLTISLRSLTKFTSFDAAYFYDQDNCEIVLGCHVTLVH